MLLPLIIKKRNRIFSRNICICKSWRKITNHSNNKYNLIVRVFFSCIHFRDNQKLMDRPWHPLCKKQSCKKIVIMISLLAQEAFFLSCKWMHICVCELMQLLLCKRSAHGFCQRTRQLTRINYNIAFNKVVTEFSSMLISVYWSPIDNDNNISLSARSINFFPYLVFYYSAPLRFRETRVVLNLNINWERQLIARL